ncbi:MAG: GTP pyrophosphokinase, partial [Candidatus Nanopelagicales bacterium]
MADDATPTAVKAPSSGDREGLRGASTADNQPTRVRAALARFGGTHKTSHPELEPLFRIVRSTHPKVDLKLIERAYEVAEAEHRGQMRLSGDLFITHPLAVA